MLVVQSHRLELVQQVAIGWKTVIRISWLVARAHNPISQSQVTQLQRLKKGIAGGQQCELLAIESGCVNPDSTRGPPRDSLNYLDLQALGQGRPCTCTAEQLSGVVGISKCSKAGGTCTGQILLHGTSIPTQEGNESAKESDILDRRGGRDKHQQHE